MPHEWNPCYPIPATAGDPCPYKQPLKSDGVCVNRQPNGHCHNCDYYQRQEWAAAHPERSAWKRAIRGAE